jgi:hypothetical protein
MCGVISSQQQKGASSRRIAMSDTTQLFILAGIWTLAAAILVYFIRNWPARIFVFALLVGVPFWELPYGYYNFQNLCKTAGGLHVLEPIAPQKTICADYPFDSSAKGLTRYGFDRVEARAKTGEITQFSKDPKGAVAKGSKRIESEYCVTFSNNNRLPWQVIRHDFTIVRADTKSVAARHSVFDWLGTWWQVAASPMLGRGGTCREDPVEPLMATLLAGSR